MSKNSTKNKKKALLELENQVSSVDVQIDNEVYRSYGLSEEEILVVEKRNEM
jgi:hypothetical protein